MSTGRDRFWTRVGAVLTGTAVAQAIPILGSLVLARLYAPAAFGFFAAWLGMAQLAAVAATGRYDNALALQGDGEPRRTAAIATLVVVAGAGALLFVASLLVLAAGGIGGVPPALLLLFAPTAMAMAASQVAQAWAAGDGQLGALSGMRVAQAAAVTGAQIAAGALWPNAEALAAAQLVGLLLGLTWALRAMPLGGAAWPSRADMCDFWRERRRFPLLSLPADGINTAAAQLPLLIVGSRFGAEAAGCLALTLRVLAAPVGLLGSAVLDVFKRDSAAVFRERGECRAIFDRTFRVLATGSGLVALALAVTAEPLFAAAFGDARIDSLRIAFALAQFERTLVSLDSRFDRYFYLMQTDALNAQEKRGKDLFFTRAHCIDCHEPPLFKGHHVVNIGLDSVPVDPGMGGRTGVPWHLGRFKTPTLRNIAVTAPYMHDGRFATLEEVVDFYADDVHTASPTLDEHMLPWRKGEVRLSQQDRADLVAFLRALTDSAFLANPRFGPP